MPRDFTLIPEGIGGSTLKEARWRLNPLLSSHRPDLILLEVGTNDILIPLFRRRGGPWKRLAGNLQFQGSVPMNTPELFHREYHELLDGLPPGVPVLPVTVACLGEVLGSDVNRMKNRYNAVIRKLAEERGTALADVSRTFEGELRNLESPSPYFLDHHAAFFLDKMITVSEAGSDYLSRRRGLHLTTDGVHLNSRGARLYAETVLKAL